MTEAEVSRAIRRYLDAIGMTSWSTEQGYRASQKRFRDVWTENGGEHVVARSARDVAEWLRGMGLDVPVPR